MTINSPRADAGLVTGPTPAASSRAVAVRGSELEQRVTQLWVDVLGRTDLGIHDNFFDVGGDSLLAIKIASIGRQLGLPISPPMLIQYQTIAELVAAMGTTVSSPPDFTLAGLAEPELESVLRQFGADDVEDVLPLAPLQEGMLFTVLAEPTARPYQQEDVYQLTGEVDIDALRHAWQTVVDRHPALRSRFVWESLPNPVQVVLRSDPVRILTELPPADEPLELAGPLQRFTLAPDGTDGYRFTWWTHHLMLDGWSRRQVISEAFDLYDAIRTGAGDPELPTVVPLRSWVAWQEECRHRDDTSFWRQHLRGFAVPTPLPDHSCVAGGSGSQVRVRVIDDSLPADLRKLAQRCRVTVGAVVHTAWALALSRSGSGSDVVFGTVVNGRYGDLPGLDRVVGMVMNTLPLRVVAEPQVVVSDLINRTGVALAELQCHASNSLVEIKRCTDLAPEVALFDSIFQFEAGPATTDRTSGAAPAADVPAPIEVGYPLTAGVFLQSSLTVQIQFSRDRLRPASAARLLSDFIEVLRAMVEDADRGVAEIVGSSLGAATVPAARPVVLAETHAGEYVAPRTTAEKTLARIWAQVLRHESVGVQDNFFALGGDSLLSVRIVAQARPEGLRFTSRDVLEQQTIARLAAAATNQPEASSSTAPADSEHRRFASAGLGTEELADLLAGLGVDEVEDLYPLSSMQLGMLFDTLTAATSDEHFRQYVWDIGGPLDADGFLPAWQQVAARHPAMRTCFRWDGLSQPVQVVMKRPPLEVRRLDGRSVPEPEQAAWLEGVLAEDEARGSALTAPPTRLMLICLADDKYRLVWTTHHMVIDGWSQQLVLNEVLELYSGAGGLTPVVPFRTYVEWTRRNLTPDNHWRETLDGFTPLAPTGDSSGSADRGWASMRVPIAPEVMESVLATARHHQVTAYALLLGVWGLAHARSGGADAIVGMALSGRGVDIAGVERIVGMLAHIAPIRVPLAPDTHLEAWLRQLQLTLVGLQHRPSQSTAEIRRAAGLPSGHRLFDTALVFDSYSRALHSSDGLLVSVVNGVASRPGCPLLCNARLDSELVLELEYWTSHYDDAAVASLVEDFAGLLSAVACAEPTMRIADVVAAAKSAPAQTGSATLTVIADVWARLLEVDRVRPEDNYFDLGGDSILAFHVVAEGRRVGLPITIRHINEFPILRDLAAAIDREAQATEPPPTRTPSAGAPALPEASTDDVPLTPIQRWFLAHAGSPQHFHQTRQLDLVGTIEAPVLERALQAVVAHHEALRLRCVRRGQTWHQHIASREDASLARFLDLSWSDSALWAAHIQEVTEQLHQSVDPSQGPLLRAALIRAPGGLPDRLAIVIHHFAVDTVSWGIILDDLRSAYLDLARGAVADLPATTTPFRDWARQLVEATEPHADAQRPAAPEAAEGMPRQLPRDFAGACTEESAASVEVVVSAEDTRALVDCARRAFSTSLNVLLLTSLGRTLTGWAGGEAALVDVERHGRDSPHLDIDLSRTVGWFTSVHPLALATVDPDLGACIAAVDTAVSTMSRPGIGGRTGVGEPRVTAEVVFNYHGRQAEQAASDGWFRFADDHSSARDPAALKRHLIELEAWIDGGCLQLTWTYSANVHRRRTVQALADRFRAILREIEQVGAHRRSGRRSASQRWRLFPGAPVMAEARARHQVPGVSVAVLSGGRLVEAWGEGSTRAENGAPVGPDTVFRACSISKHVTALGVLSLVRRGLLDLDVDARTLLSPEHSFPALDDRPVTLDQLLRHTSGLNEVTVTDASEDPPIVLERRADNDYHYSSGNYAVLESILTDATGRPFADLLREEVLDPLGMAHTSYSAAAPRHLLSDLAVGHTADGAPADRLWRTIYLLGSGGLWTTPSDLARVAQELYRSAHGLGGIVLDQAIARRMLSPRAGVNFGLGTILKSTAGQLWFGHPGDLPTFQCFTATDLHSGDGLVLMANIGLTAWFLPDLLAAIDFPIPPVL